MPETLRKTRRRMKQLQLPHTKRAQSRRVEHTCPTHDKLAGASVTYQLERVQCGKPKCRRWHGPYWYAYWTSGGRTRSLYIGKLLRPAAEVATELVERRKKKRSTVAREKQLP